MCVRAIQFILVLTSLGRGRAGLGVRFEWLEIDSESSLGGPQIYLISSSTAFCHLCVCKSFRLCSVISVPMYFVRIARAADFLSGVCRLGIFASS